MDLETIDQDFRASTSEACRKRMWLTRGAFTGRDSGYGNLAMVVAAGYRARCPRIDAGDALRVIDWDCTDAASHILVKVQSSVVTMQSWPCDAVGAAAARPAIYAACGPGE